MKQRPRLLFAALVTVDMMAVCMTIATAQWMTAGLISTEPGIVSILASGIAATAATTGLIVLIHAIWRAKRR